MIRFANPEWLWLLLGLPLLVAFLWWNERRRHAAGHAFITSELSELMAYSHSSLKVKWKRTLWLGAFALGIVAFAGPQVGTRLEEVKREGIDIFIGLDVSASMLCEDIPPNRLESAKHEILRFINGLKGDRIGLVAFAGTAVILCPLTTDYGAAKLLVLVMSQDLLPEPGTAMVDAIDRARRSFEREEGKSKVLVLVTDGEDHEGKALEAAEKAAEEGIRIYTVGLGTPQGAPIPLYDSRGNRIGFRKDKNGEIILTRQNQLHLQRIAEAGRGQYLRGVRGVAELGIIWQDIAAMDKKELGRKQFTAFEARFQYLVLPGLLLLVIEFFISERRGLFWKTWLMRSTRRGQQKREDQPA